MLPNINFNTDNEDTNMKIDIRSLSIMTSLGCNLQCDYCWISNARLNNPQYANELQKNTIAAMEDGSFIKNIQESLKRIGCSANKIETISLWGQEQTLTLEHFTNHVQEWAEAFPAWDRIDFSTNGIFGEDKIIDLIIALNNIKGRTFHFDVQFSYDGEYGSTQLRHDTEQRSIQTLKKLIEKLNNINFENVHFHSYLHGVISFDLLKELNGDIEKIKTFWENGNKEAEKISKLVINKNIDFDPIFSCSEEVPYCCSKEDGLLYLDFYQKCLLLDKMYGINILNSVWSDTAKDIFPSNYTLNEAVYSLLEIFQNNSLEELKIFTTNLSSHFYCGNSTCELKIMYDGTLVNCQNSIFETTLEGIKKENLDLTDYVKKYWVTHGYYINLLTASEEEIENYFYKWIVGRESTFWHTFNNVITMMSLLAKSQQISSYYNEDFQTLVNHAFIITYINQCHYNNAVYTGSLWLKDTGIIRRYGNGLTFLCEREQNILRKNNM